MTREEIIEFVNKHMPSYLATVENGEPRVRGMGHYRVGRWRTIWPRRLG